MGSSALIERPGGMWTLVSEAEKIPVHIYVTANIPHTRG
jgi:hypothetical protein